MFNELFLTRQFDLIDSDILNKKIIVIGAGAIGSFTVMALSKLGFSNIHVYDTDVVDNENMNCQFFKISDIGKKKTEALKQQVVDFMGLNITTYDEWITELNVDEIDCDILITAVDNMETRKIVLEESNYLYAIDPRMAAEYATMDVVHRSKGAEFSRKLFSDKDAVQERCTAKSTMYTVLLISGQICKAVKDILTGEPNIKTFDWNIKHNKLIAFSSDAKLL